MHVLTRAAIALTIAACGTAGLASTAYAEKVVHYDANGDVVSRTWDDEAGTSVTTPAPEETDGDILRTVVDHRLRKVVLTVKYAELRRVDPVMHFVALTTNESFERLVIVIPTTENPQGQVKFTNGGGSNLRCVDLERHIDYTANTLRLEIPRTCLSAPRWVRAGFGGVRDHEANGESIETFVDDANRVGTLGTVHPAYGVRVHRG